jgi:hypothetical protein
MLGDEARRHNRELDSIGKCGILHEKVPDAGVSKHRQQYMYCMLARRNLRLPRKGLRRASS